MTVNISYPAADGYLLCTSSDYTTCRNGGGTLSVDTGNTIVAWGQSKTAGYLFWNYQGFVSFAFSVGATDVVTAARIVVRGSGDFNTGIDRTLEFREYDWGASLDTGDWRPASWWGGVATLAQIYRAQAVSGRYMSAGSDSLVTRLVSGSSPLRMVCAADRQTAGIAPTTQEDSSFWSSDSPDAATYPYLTWLSTTRSTHTEVSGAQVRLAGGGWAYLHSNGAATPTITLYHREGGSSTAIGVLPIGSSSTDFAISPRGMQGLTLCRDASDNIYVIGAQGSNTGAVAVRAYVKGGGSTWTPGTLRAAPLAQFLDSGINNVVAAWHNAGTSGTIMALASHSAGRWNLNPGNDTMYVLLNCQYLLTGTGSLVRNTGSAVGTLLPTTSSSTDYSPMCNSTGTGLDVQVPPSAGTRGYVCGFAGDIGWGGNGGQISSRYTLASDGASVSSSVQMLWASGSGTKDASSKTRVLAISDTVWATVTVDARSGYGASVQVNQNVGTSTTVTLLGSVYLDGIDATMPSAATLAVSSAWDAAYDPSENKIWIYYIDATAPRTLCRTSVDLDTYLSTGDVVEVDTALGTGGGSVCRGVRVERCARAGTSEILVSCAIDTSGVLTTDVIDDDFNVSPLAPLLTATNNFDADVDHTFEWTFIDPNAGDVQIGYQVDINTSTGANVFDTDALYGNIEYGGVGAYASDPNGGPLTPALPASWTEGDVLVMLAASRYESDTLTSPPGGWTVLEDMGNVVLLGRLARAGETAPTLQFDGASTGDDVFAQIIRVVQGANDLSTIVTASATSDNAAAQDITTPALVVGVDTTMVLWVGWKQDDWTTSTEPSISTEIADVPLTAGNDMGVTWAYYYAPFATTIPADTFAITGGTSAVSKSIVVALIPQRPVDLGEYTLPAGTIANEGSYQWRVRTWDSGYLVSPWSDYQSFQTSASGTVTITDPAADNPGDIETSTTTVSWSVADTTQVSYRVVVTRTDTSAVLVDTGWVTGTETSYAITGLLSDVEYQVSVSVRDGSMVESGAGLRLLTASYGAPETPTIVATPYPDEGYVQVVVTNPPSLVDVEGAPLYTYEDGVSEMTVSGGSVAQSSAYAYSGTYSAEMTVSGAPSEMTMRAPLVAILPTEQYKVTYRAYSAAGYADLADAIDWYDAASGYLSTSAQTLEVVSGAWSLRSWLAVAPVSAAYATYGPTLADSPVSGTVLYVDDLLVQLRTDRPDPAGNALHRRRSDGTGDIIVVADANDVVVDGTYKDYTAAAQTSYEYRARATATNGSADSAWSDAVTLSLQGVWLHDPLDPDGTVLQVPYGDASRSTARETSTAVLQLAGRTYPVIEFGQPETEAYTIRAMVAHGPTWAADLEALVWFVRAKRPIVVRDNRGRSAHAMLSGYREDDAEEGTSVSFTATRMDYAETTVES